MLAALLTFLTSSAGGAISGFVMEHLARKSETAERQKDRDLEDKISERGHIVEMRKADAEIAKAKPITLKRKTELTFPMFLIFGPPVTYLKSTVRQRMPQTARDRAVGSLVIIMGIAYTLIALIFTLFMDETFPAIDPEGRERTINLLIVKWSWFPKETFNFSGGGAALWLLSPIAFILTNFTVRRGFKR